MLMNFPVVIPVGNANISLHLVMETAAFFIGFRYFLWLRKKAGDPIPPENRTWIFIAAIFGSLIGSHLAGSLERPIELWNSKNLLLYIYSNKTVLGGFLGGLWAVEIMKKILGEKHSSGDLFAYPMILGLIIGRIGCFSMGVFEETYGKPTNFFLGMNLGDGILRHPVALYEIGFLMLLWIAMRAVEKRNTLAEGARFKVFMIVYILFRFCIDFLKPPYPIFAGLHTIQLLALIGLLYYSPTLLHPKKLIKQNA